MNFSLSSFLNLQIIVILFQKNDTEKINKISHTLKNWCGAQVKLMRKASHINITVFA